MREGGVAESSRMVGYSTRVGSRELISRAPTESTTSQTVYNMEPDRRK